MVDGLRSIRPPDTALFQWVFHHQVPRVRTLQKDLIAAGIAFVDESGRRIDFHAFRVTFCTMLALSGVPHNEAMQLMRHRDPRLTMKIYLDVTQLDLPTALANLPSVSTFEVCKVEVHTESTQVGAATGRILTLPVAADFHAKSSNYSEPS